MLPPTAAQDHRFQCHNFSNQGHRSPVCTIIRGLYSIRLVSSVVCDTILSSVCTIICGLCSIRPVPSVVCHNLPSLFLRHHLRPSISPTFFTGCLSYPAIIPSAPSSAAFAISALFHRISAILCSWLEKKHRRCQVIILGLGVTGDFGPRHRFRSTESTILSKLLLLITSNATRCPFCLHLLPGQLSWKKAAMDKTFVSILFHFHSLTSIADGILCRIPCMDNTFMVMIESEPPKIILTGPLGLL